MLTAVENIALALDPIVIYFSASCSFAERIQQEDPGHSLSGDWRVIRILRFLPIAFEHSLSDE